MKAVWEEEVKQRGVGFVKQVGFTTEDTYFVLHGIQICPGDSGGRVLGVENYQFLLHCGWPSQQLPSCCSH